MDLETRIKDIFNGIIVKYDLPSGCLTLTENYGEGAKKDILLSRTVLIEEPDFPAASNVPVSFCKSTTVLNLPSAANHSIIIRKELFEAIQKSDDNDIVSVKSNLTNAHVFFSPHNDSFLSFIESAIEQCIMNYKTNKNSFDCCEKFLECSDALKCLHTNRLYSTSCTYRKKIESGRVFFGINRNI